MLMSILRIHTGRAGEQTKHMLNQTVGCHTIAYSIGEKSGRWLQFEFWRFCASFTNENFISKIRAYVIGDSEDRFRINRLENFTCLLSRFHAFFNNGFNIPIRRGCRPGFPLESQNQSMNSWHRNSIQREMAFGGVS